MRYKEIAKELSVDPGTVTRDIQFLQKRSDEYVTQMAKMTMPFLFEKALGGINEILGECWRIYNSSDDSLNWFHKLAALKLAKECSEQIYFLTKEGPFIMGCRKILREFEWIKQQSGLYTHENPKSKSDNSEPQFKQIEMNKNH